MTVHVNLKLSPFPFRRPPYPESKTCALVNSYAATLPDATHSDPWSGGHEAWKVGGKLCEVLGAHENNGLSVKCPGIETAELLIAMDRALPAPDFHRSWGRLPWGLVEEDEMHERISRPDKVIRFSLPKKVLAALG